MDRTNFVILFEGRTGSTYVCECLDSHPNIICHGEMFVDKDRSEQIKWMDKLFGQEKEENIKAVGFKTKLRDIGDREEFVTLLDKFDCRIVCMFRKNIIKLALSRLNGRRLFEQTGQWNLEQGQEPLPPFSATTKEFNDALNFRLGKDQELKEFLGTLNFPSLTVYYEELLADETGFFSKLFDYLGVESAELKSRFIKNTDDDIKNVLLNYDEIKQYYKDTEYAEMF